MGPKNGGESSGKENGQLNGSWDYKIERSLQGFWVLESGVAVPLIRSSVP